MSENKENVEVKDKKSKKKDKKDKKGKKGILKTIIALIIIFILIPAAVITAFYFSNDTFRYRFNNLMSDNLFFGKFFESLPTKEESEDQIKEIASYYLSISPDRSVDKLIIVKDDKKSLYNSIIQSMIQLDPNATKIILDRIRDIQMHKDPITKALYEINEEKDQEIEALAKEFEIMSLPTLKNEINKILTNSINGHNYLAKVFELLKPRKAHEILNMLSEEDEKKVLSFMSLEARTKISDEKNLVIANRERLVDLSKLFMTKNDDELFALLGNTANYNVDELAIILRELGSKKAAKVLSKIPDDQLVNSVIASIKNYELLEKEEDNLTKDILDGVKIYREYDDNLKRMINICATMSPDKVAKLVENLLIDNSLPETYVLDGGEVIVISEQDLAYDLLNKFDNQLVGKILSTFDEELASDVSKKITVPGGE